MKFKRDYKIHISADMNDACFWTATHKGERKVRLDVDDYKTILSMLDEIRGYVSDAIAEKS